MHGRKTHLDSKMKVKAVISYKKYGDAKRLSETFGVTERTIYFWLKIYKDGGFRKKTTEVRGRPSKINFKKSKELLKIIKKPASFYGFENDLWNTTRLKIICKKKLKIELSRMALWRFLDKFNQSFKKVQKQYYEANISAQKDWKRKILPKIKRIIKNHRAVLYFEDESCIQLSPVMGRTCGPIGKKVVHQVTGNRGSISAISAISNDGRLIFNVFDGGKRFNSEDIIQFLNQMLKYHQRRHLVVIMDRASCHTSKKTNEFIKSRKRLHVFFLPARSPELNPDEQVWAHLKNHELKSHKERDLKGLKKLTCRKLKRLSKNPKKLRGIFKRCDNAHLFHV